MPTEERERERNAFFEKTGGRGGVELASRETSESLSLHYNNALGQSINTVGDRIFSGLQISSLSSCFKMGLEMKCCLCSNALENLNRILAIRYPSRPTPSLPRY